MILGYFNEQGFRIEGSLGEVIRTYDAPGGIESDATALYCFRWFVFNNLMEQLRELGNPPQGEELLLYTDSRLVEELNGDVKTDAKFAGDSRLYYIRYDLPRFKRVRVEKCSPTTIRRKLEPISNPRH
jgi:hypothetical protein